MKHERKFKKAFKKLFDDSFRKNYKEVNKQIVAQFGKELFELKEGLVIIQSQLTKILDKKRA